MTKIFHEFSELVEYFENLKAQDAPKPSYIRMKLPWTGERFCEYNEMLECEGDREPWVWVRVLSENDREWEVEDGFRLSLPQLVKYLKKEVVPQPDLKLEIEF